MMGGAGHIELIARGVLRRGTSVLVCRSLVKGHAYLPGGHIEFGEDARAALARELLEEAGAVVTPGECLQTHVQVFSTADRVHHEVNLLFHVEHSLGGVVRSLEPDLAFEWVDSEHIATSGLVPADAVELLQRLCRGLPIPPFRL